MCQMRYACVSELREKRMEMRGSGVLSGMRNFLGVVNPVNIASNLAFGKVGTAISNFAPNSDANARPLFPGEQHAFLRVGNSVGRANFMGPGTEIVKRLKRGDTGRTKADTVAMMHDIQYSLASDVSGVRKADERMVKTLKKIEKSGGDSRFNTQQGMRLIQAKMKLEDAGVNPLRFATFGGIAAPDIPMLEATEKKLEIEGYGAKKKVSKKLSPGVALRRKLLKNHKDPKDQNGGWLKSCMALSKAGFKAIGL
jgi:hypothetical protein